MLKFLLAQIFFLSHVSHASESYLTNFEGSRPSEYIIQNFPDEKLMTVRLLGGVKKPGIYRIPRKTSLLTLLTYSGGPNERSDTDSIVISGAEKKHVSLAEVLAESHKDPLLQPNETIYIRADEPLVSQDTLAVTSLISTGLGIILTVLVASKQL